MATLSLLQARWRPRIPTSFQGGRAILYLGVAIAILMAVAAGTVVLIYSYEQTQIRAATKTQGLAKSLELTFEGLLDTTNIALLASIDEFERQLASGKIDAAAFTRFLERQNDRLPYLGSLRASNARGDLIYGRGIQDPPVNIADREHFLRLRDDASTGLVVGAALRSLTDGNPVWPIARRINMPDGTFGGAIVATYRISEIDAMLAQIKLDPQGSIGLRAPGMRMITRITSDEKKPQIVGNQDMSTPLQDAMKVNPREGTYVSDSKTSDHVRRIYSYRRNPKYEFIVFVGASVENTFAQWYQQAWIIGGLVGAFIAVSLSFSALILRAWARQEENLDEIKTSEQSLNEAQGIARLGSYVYDLRTHSWTRSDALNNIFGIDDDYPRDMPHWLELVCAESRMQAKAHLDRLMDERLPFEHEYRIVRRCDGQERWVHCTGRLRLDEQANPVALVGTYQDITDRKVAEETINQLAFFDQLTGLPNRTLLLDRIRQSMASSSRSGIFGALLLIDLDRFKILNDTHGHEIGDLLLKQVAQRLMTCLRGEDTVARSRAEDTAARLGGDEFVVVLSNLGSDRQQAAAHAKVASTKIQSTLGQAYQLAHIDFVGTASIGVTMFRGQQTTLEDLLKQADLAMYRAKAAGRNEAHFFDPAMEEAARKHALLEGDLRRGIEEGQFLLHYQAQVTIEGSITGAEVLARWQHPQRGVISPEEFIPIAEETALILPLGNWVLETACTQLANWAKRPEMAHLTLAVNVSARQFRQADFVDQVLAVLRNTDANPHRLNLELTESLLVEDVEEVIAKMTALRAVGVGFSLDDFGTGYSSLSYLKRLPLDHLKIDQSFVRDVLTDPNDAAIAKIVVALGQSLGLGVIAEGVETQAQKDCLAAFGCHAYQGYFFSQPLLLNDFEKFAQRGWDHERRESGIGQVGQPA